MTAARVAAARAEIARLRTLAEAATPGWAVDPWEWAYPRAAHIAAWDPARVLRVLDAAEKTLDRHAPWGDDWRAFFCADEEHRRDRDGDPDVDYPCAEVLAVLDTYLPEKP